MSGGKPSLRHLLTETDRFITGIELVTSRGVITSPRASRQLAIAQELAGHPRIDLMNMTDNPAGSAMITADTMAADLRARGQEVCLHLACKDWNRNALQSRAYKLASEGYWNVLALSGDVPVSGFQGVSAGVFDIDAVGLLRMYTDLNEQEGLEFFMGAVVTNHKANENEVVPQLLKLRKKVDNGARWIINQVGYNARKDDELLRWMHNNGLGEIPVLANVYVLAKGAARAFNANRVPGCRVSDRLLEAIMRESEKPDGGKGFFHDLAARQVVVARGLGYRGAYIGGHLEAADYLDILDRADAYGWDSWRELARTIDYEEPGEWYFYDRDERTGLSSDRLNPEYAKSLEGRRRGHGAPLRYRFSRGMHNTVFAEDAPLFKLGTKLYEGVEKAPKWVGKTLHMAEQANKVPLFECRDCGDCSLPDIAYLCPESQCAKNQRNGPCGGTRPGSLCEVGDKLCIWARAYDRLKPYGEELTMLDGPVVIKDNALARTSAWQNTFLHRDHHAKALAAAEEERKALAEEAAAKASGAKALPPGGGAAASAAKP
ncbi:MAG TPA: methylenetetrahydrofolate reductase C-terminal domain-containing protein [Solirubrobacteraceae bacterium]|nr:methylenetetrahydrofolate reductase C-terminal domain-containing protein [Solirubrobacteraceae bacterium]